MQTMIVIGFAFVVIIMTVYIFGNREDEQQAKQKLDFYDPQDIDNFRC